MKKFLFVIALVFVSVFAFASPETDAIKAFYVKGSSLIIDMSFSNKDGTMTVFTAVPKEKVSAIQFANSKAGDKVSGVLVCNIDRSAFKFPKDYIKSISNDAAGNLVLTLVPIDIEKMENNSFSRVLERLLSDVL